jgi:hypothetical protein
MIVNVHRHRISVSVISEIKKEYIISTNKYLHDLSCHSGLDPESRIITYRFPRQCPSGYSRE